MTRYVETFLRHKWLLSAPIALALFMSVWYVAVQPHTYAATTAVWIDAPLPSASTIDAQSWNAPPPANQAQSVLQELLATRAFLVKVGRRGPLVDYVTERAHASVGSRRVTPKMVDDGLVAMLTSKFTSWVVGPQVIRVSMSGPDPTVVTGTLNAMVEQYFDEVTAVRQNRLKAVLDYYKPRLDAAAEVLARTRAAEIAYLREHPLAGSPGVLDPQFSALATAASTAQSEFNALETSYGQANQQLATADASTASHVIDRAEDAVRLSSKKKAAFAGVGGIAFGVVVSLVGLAILTALDSTARRREDLEEVGAPLQVVATIPHLKRASS